MTMGWLCGMHTTDNSQQIKFNQWPNQPIFIYQMNNISEKNVLRCRKSDPQRRRHFHTTQRKNNYIYIYSMSMCSVCMNVCTCIHTYICVKSSVQTACS